MNKLTQKVVSTKDFVYKHRVAIAVTVTSAFWINAMVKTAATHNEFLKEHNLFDEFYKFDEDE